MTATAPLLQAILETEEDMQGLARRLARLLAPGDWLLLSGTLGAGKTTFARAVLQALGHVGDVPSPTFTLVQSYEDQALAFPVWHVDLYRLSTPLEVIQLGLDDNDLDRLLMIEWPERLPVLPPHALQIDFHVQPHKRLISFSGNDVWRARLSGLLDPS
jgi:tRNA threonylcarbamoyladenosine biosynthesis protein TsaE